MRKFKTGILVGKRMIEKMQAMDINVHYRTLSNDEYIVALHEKLVEEVAELRAETAKDKVIAELADIIEVIECIKEAYDIDEDILAKIRHEKLNSKGSYSDRTLTEFLEIANDNPAIKYYLERPNKYPEIC